MKKQQIIFHMGVNRQTKSQGMKKATYLLIFITLLAAFMLPTRAEANLLCRADPVVILSNGVTMDFGATITTLPMFVTEVHYELHVPAGVSLVAVIHTPTWLTSQETFTFYADQPAGQYTIITTVHTSVGNTSVVADGTLISPFGLRLDRGTAPGVEGSPITLVLNT
jgi:hypothetical protein